MTEQSTSLSSETISDFFLQFQSLKNTLDTYATIAMLSWLFIFIGLFFFLFYMATKGGNIKIDIILFIFMFIFLQAALFSAIFFTWKSGEIENELHTLPYKYAEIHNVDICQLLILIFLRERDKVWYDAYFNTCVITGKDIEVKNLHR